MFPLLAPVQSFFVVGVGRQLGARMRISVFGQMVRTFQMGRQYETLAGSGGLLELRHLLAAVTLIAMAPVALTAGGAVSQTRTPATQTLAAADAERVLERDWLFQAMGDPLRSRTTLEIKWTRELAQRLIAADPRLDLASELQALNAAEQRLASHQDVPAAPRTLEVEPSWIWYAEGNPSQNAPAESRFFRCRFQVPAEVQAAELRVAADDACEVFLNGQPVGKHGTWARTGRFSVGEQLRVGENLLAIRADNMPAPSLNPAGLIARLAMTLADGRQLMAISDATWRSADQAYPGWEQLAFDDASWSAAIITAPYGGGPWGKIAGLGADVQSDPVAAYAAEDPVLQELYFCVRGIKRAILFKNPVIDFTQLLFIDQPLPQGPINPEHEAIHRMGITAVPGGPATGPRRAPSRWPCSPIGARQTGELLASGSVV